MKNIKVVLAVAMLTIFVAVFLVNPIMYIYANRIVTSLKGEATVSGATGWQSKAELRLGFARTLYVRPVEKLSGSPQMGEKVAVSVNGFTLTGLVIKYNQSIGDGDTILVSLNPPETPLIAKVRD